MNCTLNLDVKRHNKTDYSVSFVSERVQTTPGDGSSQQSHTQSISVGNGAAYR